MIRCTRCESTVLSRRASLLFALSLPVFRVIDPIVVFYVVRPQSTPYIGVVNRDIAVPLPVGHHYASVQISVVPSSGISKMGLTKQKAPYSSGPWSTHHHTRFVRDTFSRGKACAGTSVPRVIGTMIYPSVQTCNQFAQQISILSI